MELDKLKELNQGRQVDRFTIKSRTGTSTLSNSYLACDQHSKDFLLTEYCPHSIVERDELGMLVLTDSQNSDSFKQGIKRFESTANILAGINNPNIPRITDLVFANNTAYLVEEFEEAFELAEVLSHSSVLEYEDIKNIIFPLLDAFRVLHKNDCLHLNVNKQSIKIRKDGSPILCNIGSLYANHKTGEGVKALARDNYTPIEFYSDDPEFIGPWSDAYSIAAVLYECICGEKPPTALERYKSQKQYGIDLVETLVKPSNDKYSRQLLCAIDHALKLKPNDRPKSIGGWLGEILELSSDENRDNESAGVDLDKTLGIKIASSESESSLNESDTLENNETKYKLARSYIGGKRQAYYMSAFMHQDERAYIPRIRLNYGALLFSIIWMVYRKMYLMAFTVMPVIVAGFVFFFHHFSANNLKNKEFLLISPTIDFTAIASLLAISLFLALFGNYIYYLNIMRMIGKACRKHPSVREQRKYLSKVGFVSQKSAIVASILLGVLCYGSYISLLEREKIAGVQMEEALFAVKEVSRLVHKYKTKNGNWPNDISELVSQSSRKNYKYVKNISVIKQLIVVTFRNEEEILPQLAGQSFALYGSEESETGYINWICGSISLGLEHLPDECKRYLK